MTALARRAYSRSRGVARNTAVSAFRTLIRLAVGFALLPLLLHGIGSAQTGLFLFATTLTGYFTAIDLSVGSSVTRYVAEHRAKRSARDVATTVRSSLAVMLAMGLIIAAVLAVVGLTASSWLFREPQLKSLAERTIIVAAVTMIVYWPSRVGVAALNGIERYDLSAWIQIATSLAMLIGIAALARAHASVVLMTGLFGLVASAEGAIAAAFAWRPLGVDRSWLGGSWFRGAQMREVLRFSIAAFVIGVSATLLNGFDRAIVGVVLGAAAIVSYDLAQRPYGAVQTVAGIAGIALVSPVARLAALGQHDRARALVLVASLISVAVTAPLAVLVMVLAQPFVVAWLGPQYAQDAVFIDVFVSISVFNCCSSALSSALYGIGQLRTYAWIVIVMSIVSLPLSVVLTVLWGTVGVIWGTVIPSACALPVFVVYALRRLEIPVATFWREVLLPGYAPVLVWGVAILLADSTIEPTGYAGLVAFSAVALPICWAAYVPILLGRIRGVGVGVPAPAAVDGPNRGNLTG
jgi:O-antigen/teichoic acid export membrane protein